MTHVEFHIVGVTYDHRQRAIAALAPGDPILLHIEPDNPVDTHAVAAVTQSGHQIGYLAREDAANWAAAISFAGGVTGRVDKMLGGTEEKPTRGVIVACDLASPPADYSLPIPSVSRPQNTRGFSFESFVLGAAIAAACAGAVALWLISTARPTEAPRGEVWWREIGTVGASPAVFVVETVPFGADSDMDAFGGAIRTLCEGRTICRIAFVDLRWPEPDAALPSNQASASLLAFYRDGLLRVDCQRYTKAADDLPCLPSTRAQLPPPAPAAKDEGGRAAPVSKLKANH